MKIRFKEIKTEIESEAVESLYLNSFPPEERREFNELKQQIFADECALNLIIADAKYAGFCILWDFTDFIFMEHFAIEPKLRGCGIGEGTLRLISEKYNKPLILEVEPPIDELGKRRINFYIRNGFNLIDRHYLQPSYGGNKPEVEMKLMSSKKIIDETELSEWILKIREKVYLTF